MRLGFRALLLVLGATAPAFAQASGDCRDDSGTDRCSAEQQARVRTLFGVEAIETHAARDEQVRRVFFVDGYGSDLLALSFVRAPGKPPTLEVRAPKPDERSTPAPLTAPVPMSIWNQVLHRSRHFDRKLVAVANEDPKICMHAWVYTVEASDPPRLRGKPPLIRRAPQDACAAGLVAAYASCVAEAALPLTPHCAALDPEQHRNRASQLNACFILDGDRLAAARALNGLGPFRHARKATDRSDVPLAFAQEAVIDWAGEVRTLSWDRAMEAWLSKREASGAGLFYARVHGSASDRVRIDGHLQRWIDPAGNGPASVENAPVTLDVRFGSDRAWRIERATVGAFSRAAPRR